MIDIGLDIKSIAKISNPSEAIMKTLIVYSTKYGSVEKVAMKLKEKLTGEVETANVKSKPAIDKYDTVILGGSIYAGNIQKDMRRFIKDNLNALQQKRIGLFICAGTSKDEVAASYLEKCYPQELHNKALAKANLGYEYDLERFSFIDRLIVRIVGVKKSGSVFYEQKIAEFAAAMNS